MKYYLIILLWIILGFTFSLNILQNREKEETELLNSFNLTKLATKLIFGDFASFDEDFIS